MICSITSILFLYFAFLFPAFRACFFLLLSFDLYFFDSTGRGVVTVFGGDTFFYLCYW